MPCAFLLFPFLHSGVPPYADECKKRKIYLPFSTSASVSSLSRHAHKPRLARPSGVCDSRFQILIWRSVTNSLLQRRRGTALAVDEEVVIRMCATGVSWILFCGTRFLLRRNKVIRGRETFEKATSSSTATAVPLPRWGRLNTPINCNLSLLKHRSVMPSDVLVLCVFNYVRNVAFECLADTI